MKEQVLLMGVSSTTFNGFDTPFHAFHVKLTKETVECLLEHMALADTMIQQNSNASMIVFRKGFFALPVHVSSDGLEEWVEDLGEGNDLLLTEDEAQALSDGKLDGARFEVADYVEMCVYPESVFFKGQARYCNDIFESGYLVKSDLEKLLEELE